MVKKISIVIFQILDIILFPLTIVTAAWSKVITAMKVKRATLSEKIFMTFGILPVRDHYYEPLINPVKHLRYPLDRDRHLPGIDMNIEGQLEVLKKFKYSHELLKLPMSNPGSEGKFYFNNQSFESGDAEYWYDVIRTYKPSRIIEIGSGFSTLIAQEAIKKNKEENAAYSVEHICIEPYEQPWLEKTGAKIVRKKVEDLELSLFQSLGPNDVLFIDSSHMVRPQGDVLFEFLEILPLIKSGVLVHVHDIFSPRDYPREWIVNDHKLWNEQYLLEAFLSMNDRFEVIGALNYLSHHHVELFRNACPVFAKEAGREPGSFWMRRK
jgi:hypothetical protein